MGGVLLRMPILLILREPGSPSLFGREETPLVFSNLVELFGGFFASPLAMTQYFNLFEVLCTTIFSYGLR